MIEIAYLLILLSQNGAINLEINSHILVKNEHYHWFFKINKHYTAFDQIKNDLSIDFNFQCFTAE